MARLEGMRVFAAVAELGGFAPAARLLRMSPSAVTRHVAALEDDLGARLLQRTTRSVRLTDAGARYLSRVRRILSEIAEAEDAVQAERTDPRGRFVVAAPNVFGRLHVSPLMCRMLSEYPALVGELLLADRMANLIEEGIDVAIRIGRLDDSPLIARTVGATRTVVVASPTYLRRSRREPSLGHLDRHAIIQCTPIDPLPEWRLVRDGAEQRVRYAPRYSTNSVDAAIGHALSHGGLTRVLGYQVIDEVRAGQLKVLFSGLEPPPLPIQIVYPSTRLLSAKVRVFVDLVAKSCDWNFVEL